MMKVYIISLTVLFALLAGTEAKGSSLCPCVPSKGDCGEGFRVGVCEKKRRKINCKVLCNWKKEFGADCLYRFGSWGECGWYSGTKQGTGTLYKVLYEAECQTTVSVIKPCNPKPPPRPRVPETEPKPAPVIENKPAPATENKPTKPKGAEMTEADKAYIVNRLRTGLIRGVKPTPSKKLLPPARRPLLKMSWSEEAAAKARRFADKCTKKHGPSFY